MAQHTFGIMEFPPKENEVFETYEPELYENVSIHDDFIEPMMERWKDIDCYWHGLYCPEKNLAYCGISLIPPGSLGAFIETMKQEKGMEDLQKLLKKAEEEKKYVIHFGI